MLSISITWSLFGWVSTIEVYLKKIELTRRVISELCNAPKVMLKFKWWGFYQPTVEIICSTISNSHIYKIYSNFILIFRFFTRYDSIMHFEIWKNEWSGLLIHLVLVEKCTSAMSIIFIQTDTSHLHKKQKHYGPLSK